MSSQNDLANQIREEIDRVFGHSDWYLTDIRYDGLECDKPETITMVGNTDVWEPPVC